MALFFELFLEGDFLFFFFWMDLGRLLEVKMEVKICFSDVFCDSFFECGLASILNASLEAPNLKK